MSIQLLAIIVLSLLLTATTLRLLWLEGERERATEDNARLNAAVGRHLREGLVYGQEVAALERRNAYLEGRRRMVMARWWKRRNYRTLSSWLNLKGTR